MACLFFRKKLKIPFYIYPRSQKHQSKRQLNLSNQSKLGNKKHLSYNRVRYIYSSECNQLPVKQNIPQ